MKAQSLPRETETTKKI
jgi:hypothetical protein